MTDLSIVICGAAGQGIKTVEDFLVQILKEKGYHVFATKEYESRVRGGINSTELRVGDRRVAAYIERIDILIPLHKDAMKHLENRITDSTYILADPKTFDDSFKIDSKHLLLLEIIESAKEIGGNIYSNIIAVGAIASLFQLDTSLAQKYINQKFKKKGQDIIDKDILAFNKGYQLASEIIKSRNLSFNLEPTPSVDEDILFDGNQGIALGAIAGGCNFISAYPMSPSTGVLIFLAQHSEEFEILIDQAEDEIAAINKAIGAWYAGARALASTSGGGFALMGEGISLAAITETPIVIHDAQRPGPATGLPTRTGQEDLNLVVYAGHGEFPRIVYAPGTIQQAFQLAQIAFNLADELQIPIIILTDQYFVDSYYNIPVIETDNIENIKHFVESKSDYKRYLFTENGISPRGIPGFGEGLVRSDSDEHDEYGHITEDLTGIRMKMVDKRLIKRFELVKQHIISPELVGPKDFEILVICWGSNYHPVKEALETISNKKTAMLHFSQVYPIDPKSLDLMKKARKLLIVENNAMGQFCNLLKLHLGISIENENKLLSFSGEPTSVEKVVKFINSRVEAK